MPRVYTANPYRFGSLGSLGNAEYMLLRQYQFPDTYREDEKIILADHDRCIQWDYNHAMGCFKKHTKTGDMGLEGWLRDATNDQVIAFLKDILKADLDVRWTGYRIMGTVNRGNGYPVWTLELFAKNTNSETKVYTGANAPNVNSPKSAWAIR